MVISFHWYEVFTVKDFHLTICPVLLMNTIQTSNESKKQRLSLRLCVPHIPTLIHPWLILLIYVSVTHTYIWQHCWQSKAWSLSLSASSVTRQHFILRLPANRQRGCFDWHYMKQTWLWGRWLKLHPVKTKMAPNVLNMTRNDVTMVVIDDTKW